MKAVILAANRSNRLSPFIETRCKPMIRIAGQYILENTICFLKEAGINDIVLVVNHQQGPCPPVFWQVAKYLE